MFGIRRGYGDLICIMRSKRLAIAAAEQLTGQTWKHLVDVDGCVVMPVKAYVAEPTATGDRALFRPGFSDLWGCFGRGDGFLTLPRSLMHEMPDDWQSVMAELLDEWERAWNWPDDFPTATVRARDKKNRFTKWPAWLLEYKYREQHRDQIEAIRAKGE